MPSVPVKTRLAKVRQTSAHRGTKHQSAFQQLPWSQESIGPVRSHVKKVFSQGKSLPAFGVGRQKGGAT